MSEIKVYIGCCKKDFYLLRSCIASIRYWNKQVPVYLLKDFSKGDFDTVELETIFNAAVVETKYKKLGGYMKLQPYIEHPDEQIFLQDADMVWLGDIMLLLKNIATDIAVQTYTPEDLDTELNRWYFNTSRLKAYYQSYKYPGFVFNCGSIFMKTNIFQESNFKDIIVWQEFTRPTHDKVFLCEDQGIINYVVARKYNSKLITITSIEFQIPSETDEAKRYNLEKIKKYDARTVIVHWLGTKNGLNGFCAASHLLRFYERQYYNQVNNGKIKILIDRLSRTIRYFDKFMYESVKKIYYAFIPSKK